MKVKYLVIIFLSLVYAELYSQNENDTKESKLSRISIHISMGATKPFNQFLHPDNLPDNFSELEPLSFNNGIGIKYFHKNNWVSSLGINVYDPSRGVAIITDWIEISSDPLEQGKFGKSKVRGSFYNSITYRIGRIHHFNNPKWQANWLAGINFELITKRGFGLTRLGNNEYIGLKEVIPERRLGVTPGIQAGYQIAYRMQRWGFSLLAIGNLGLRYYYSQDFIGRLGQDIYNVQVNSKGDLIAVQLQIEYNLKRR